MAYYGYQQVSPLDISSFGKSISEGIQLASQRKAQERIEQKKALLERQKRKEGVLDKFSSGFENLETAIGNTTSSVLVDTGMKIRNKISEYSDLYDNEQIDEKQLARFKNGINGSISVINKAVNGAGENLKIFEEAVTSAKNTDEYSQFIASQIGSLYNLKDIEIDFDKNGEAIWYKTKDGERDPNSMPQRLFNFVNIQSFSSDYQAPDFVNQFKVAVDNIADYTDDNGIKRETSPRLNPQFLNLKNQFLSKFNDSKFAGRYLLYRNPSKYKTYQTLDQKESLLAEGYNEEDLLQITYGDGGVNTIKLTDEQISSAKQLADNQFEGLIEFKKDVTKPSTGTGTSTEKKPTERQIISIVANNLASRLSSDIANTGIFRSQDKPFFLSMMKENFAKNMTIESKEEFFDRNLDVIATQDKKETLLYDADAFNKYKKEQIAKGKKAGDIRILNKFIISRIPNTPTGIFNLLYNTNTGKSLINKNLSEYSLNPESFTSGTTSTTTVTVPYSSEWKIQ